MSNLLSNVAFQVIRCKSTLRYKGPRFPVLTYDVVIRMKDENHFLEHTSVASIPKIGDTVHFTHLFGCVDAVVYRTDGLIDITLEHSNLKRT